MAYSDRAKWSSDYHSMKIGRKAYLDSDSSARPDTAKALTKGGHSIRAGRPSYSFADPSAYPAPSDILISNALVVENSAVGTLIGTLTIVDKDSMRPTLELVDDASGKVRLVGNRLEVAGPIDYETTPTFNVILRATDELGQTFIKAQTIIVTDVSEVSYWNGTDTTYLQVINTQWGWEFSGESFLVGTFETTGPHAGEFFNPDTELRMGASDFSQPSLSPPPPRIIYAATFAAYTDVSPPIEIYCRRNYLFPEIQYDGVLIGSLPSPIHGPEAHYHVYRFDITGAIFNRFYIRASGSAPYLRIYNGNPL